MLPSPTHMTTRRSISGNQKLRSSCDGCGAAKVKCDRSQPQCSRCRTLGQSCSYGISRKFGKPPRKLLRLHSSMNGELPSQRSVGQGRDENTTERFGDAKEPVASNPAHTVASFDDTVLPDINFAPLTNATEQNHFDPPSGWSFDDWPPLDILGFPLSMPATILKDIPHNNNQISPSAPESTNNSTGMSSGTKSAHSCTRSSYEIFRDLICLSPDLHAPDSVANPVSVQVDEILSCTRDAVDRLRLALQCPCAKSGHRAMVHASIISRILIWYQQAAGPSSFSPQLDGQVSSPPPPSEMLVSSDTAPPTNAETGNLGPSQSQSHVPTGFTIVNVPLKLGTFTIEDESMQAAFKTQLILNELKIIGSLIELFSSLDSVEKSTSPTRCIGPGLNSHLGAWLRDEHARIEGPLKLKLKELHATLEI